MFFLCSDASGVGLFEYPVAGAALPIPPPAIACSTQHPSGPFFGCALGTGIGSRCAGVLAAGWGHDRLTEEMTLFHPDAIDVADAPADVFPGY